MIAPLLLALSLQGPASLADGTPDQKAAALATLDLVYGCMLTLPAYDSVAGYAGAAERMGSGLPPPAPAWSAAVRMDGVNGRGCRVRYTGPMADDVWRADLKFLHGQPPAPTANAANGCAFTADTPTRLAGTCASTSEPQDGRPGLTRRGDVTLERDGAGAAGGVTFALLNARP